MLVHACVLSRLSCVTLCATPWTVMHQAPWSMGFSRQEYWSGLPFPPPGDLPNPGIEPVSPALVGRFFTPEPPGKTHTSSLTHTCTHTHAHTHYQIWLRADVLLPWRQTILKVSPELLGWGAQQHQMQPRVSRAFLLSCLAGGLCTPHTLTITHGWSHSSFFSTRKWRSLPPYSFLFCPYLHGLLALSQNKLKSLPVGSPRNSRGEGFLVASVCLWTLHGVCKFYGAGKLPDLFKSVFQLPSAIEDVTDLQWKSRKSMCVWSMCVNVQNFQKACCLQDPSARPSFWQWPCAVDSCIQRLLGPDLGEWPDSQCGEDLELILELCLSPSVWRLSRRTGEPSLQGSYVWSLPPPERLRNVRNL